MKREYTDQEIAAALAALRANAGNAKKTARDLGIPRSSLRQWAGRNEATTTGSTRHIDEGVADEARTTLARTFRTRAQQLVDAVDEEKIAKASAKDLLIAAGIATEKAELLSGGPTNRTEMTRVSLIEPDVLKRDTLKVIEGGRK